MMAPETNDARSDARNAATSATSFGLPAAAQRGLLEDAGHELGVGAHDLGVDEAGADRVDPDALGAVLDGARTFVTAMTPALAAL